MTTVEEAFLRIAELCRQEGKCCGAALTAHHPVHKFGTQDGSLLRVVFYTARIGGDEADAASA
jgi:hypothetical protein